MSGPLRAAGKQVVGAIVYWIAHFGVALPISALAVFKFDMGLKGAWMGPLISAIVNTIALNAYFMYIEWPTLMRDAAGQREADRGEGNNDNDLDTSETRESDNYHSLNNKTNETV